MGDNMKNLNFDRRVKLIKAHLRGASVSWICSKYGVSRKTFYYHLQNFNKDGWSGLKRKSRRPHTICRTPPETVDYIRVLREFRGWGPTRIEGHLRKQKPEGVKAVGHNTIYRILCEAGLNKPLTKPRRAVGKTRFERSRPNQLWQADWKLTRDDEWMITFLDDCSRFIPGSRIHDHATAENTVNLFRRCVKAYGTPEQVLTDQGVQFHTLQEDGVTQFDKFCRKKSIQHILAGKRRPTTIGKVERFHRSYEEEAWRYPSHQDYIHHYNHERPHQALDYLTPADIYFKQL